MAEFPDDFGFSVSRTTNDPRPGEQVGVDYHLVTREKMQGDTDAGLVVEHAEVHANLYGNSISAVQEVTKKGRMCLLDIDVQGAESVYGEHSLFIHFLLQHHYSDAGPYHQSNRLLCSNVS